MSVTFTDNYRDILAKETVAYIDSLTEANYSLDDMLVFIDETGESDFNRYYETYIELGEEYGFDPVEAFLKIYGVCDLDEFAERYLGEYTSSARMAQDYFEGDGDLERLDYRIVIDFEATAEYLLDHDVDRVGDYYFRCYR